MQKTTTVDIEFLEELMRETKELKRETKETRKEVRELFKALYSSKIVSTDGLLRLLGLCKRKIQYMKKSGELPHVELGGIPFFLVDEIIAQCIERRESRRQLSLFNEKDRAARPQKALRTKLGLMTRKHRQRA